MAASLKQLLEDQEELAKIISEKCLAFDQRIKALTPVETIMRELETALKKCKDKQDVLKSYGDHEVIKEYLKGGLIERVEHNVETVREKVLGLQSGNIAEVTRIRTNFKKDSATRKTQAYLEKRLSALEEAFALVVDYNDALKL
jgi:DNA repair exonuclease SbcCD ATPase subunit